MIELQVVCERSIRDATSTFAKQPHPEHHMPFVIRFTGYLVLFGSAYGTGLLANLTAILVGNVVFVAALIVSSLGQSFEVTGTTLAGMESNVTVTDACSGIDLLLIIAAGVLAYPTSAAWKGVGLVGTAGVVVCMNSLRVATLFLIIQWWPRFFDTAHHVVWQGLLIAAAVSAWSIWAMRAPSAPCQRQ